MKIMEISEIVIKLMSDKEALDYCVSVSNVPQVYLVRDLTDKLT